MYYRTTSPVLTEVWQLFLDGTVLTSARWPNAQAWSDEAWERERGWASQGQGTSCGHSVDAGTAFGVRLNDTTVSMNGM